jgi:hypothetical protein
MLKRSFVADLRTLILHSPQFNTVTENVKKTSQSTAQQAELIYMEIKPYIFEIYKHTHSLK